MNPFSDPVARVVAYTQPVPELAILTTNKDQSKPLAQRPMTMVEFIAYCARVSNPENQWNVDTMPKLLNFLAKNHHWSPFEMASVTVEVKTSRAIAHQLLRHRSFSFQEFSQRYSSVEAVEPVEWEARLKGATNRQSSLENEDPELESVWKAIQSITWNRAMARYKEMLERGIAPEVARALLPEGLTPTTLYVAGTVRSWIHYLAVRLDPHTQKEHRDGLALPIKKAIIVVLPELEAILP